MQDQIFITGATGCIGHYVLDELKQVFPNAHYHLFARRPERFKNNAPDWDNTTVYPFELNEMESVKDVLPNMDYIIHIATVWGYNLDDNIKLNRDKTLEMFNYCDPKKLKKIIYFSTASILTANNELNEVAKTDGIPYVQSKYHAYVAIQESKWADKIITLFPTVVLGGGNGYPISHISSGFKTIRKTMRYLKWLRLKGSFHFLHAKDIAKVTVACLNQTPSTRDIVLGNPEVTFNSTIKSICNYLKINTWFQIPLSSSLILVVIAMFRIKVDSWARYCIKHPNFSYNVQSPEHFNLDVSYPKIEMAVGDILNEQQ